MARTLRDKALAIYQAGLAAADPERLVRDRLREDASGIWLDGELCLDPPGPRGRLRIFGAGKAAASLAKALEERLGAREYAGRLIVKRGHGVPLRNVIVEEGGHPLPDQAGFAATKRLLEDLEDSRAEDRIFFLLTGGASALLVAPAPGLSLEDKIQTTDLLLSAGASIQELNAVRKHLSAVKGGRLMERMAPARVLALVISDVIGDDLSSIGSGPAVADPTTFRDALEVLQRYDLVSRAPAAVVGRLREGASGRASETPKLSDPLFASARHVILASNRHSLRAARDHAAAMGLEVEVFGWDLEGEAHETARAFARALSEGRARSRPCALLAGGELTLKVTGSGRGGRSQEFALVAARELRGVEGVAVLAAGTDGSDGPTDAAGAFADGTSWERAQNQGLDPQAYLDNNDAYALFEQLGDLFKTGPTGTNVNDLVIGLIEG